MLRKRQHSLVSLRQRWDHLIGVSWRLLHRNFSAQRLEDGGELGGARKVGLNELDNGVAGDIFPFHNQFVTSVEHGA